MSDITQISLNGIVYDLRDTKFMNSITNCITEIPQDIKLELSSGTLTLKAGSKVYVPNGSGVFNTQTISSDKTTTRTATSVVQRLVFYTNTDGLTVAYDMNKISSGTTDSLAGQAYHVWYDTTNNSIKMYGSDSSTPQYTGALPLGIITINGANGISSIDQVFNGFGYVGSTVFALPGTTQLIPNSFNADGTLKNTKLTANTVQTRTLTATVSNAVLAARFNAGTPFGVSNEAKYDESRNINTSSGVDWNYGFIGTISASSGKITSFTTKQVFHAVDYSDTDFIAHQAGPSNRYVDLSLPASGGTITAPADGYLYVAKLSGNANEFIRMTTPNAIGVIALTPAGSMTANLTLSVSKGDVVTISYNLSGTTNSFRFVYANGAK